MSHSTVTKPLLLIGEMDKFVYELIEYILQYTLVRVCNVTRKNCGRMHNEVFMTVCSIPISKDDMA